MSLYRSYGFLAVLFMAAQPFWAQTTTGNSLGTVRDSSGGLITDAKVIVRNLDTNQAQETMTSATGVFRVPLLPAGSYEVRIEKAGFATYRQGPISLSVNQEADLNITLTVSATSETIAVTSEAPLIDTTGAEISTRFDTKRVADLPLSTNRNIL